MPRTTAIVVAAGSGERFGGLIPKVLVVWRGRSLLAWTLDVFDRCAVVDDVVLVASEAVEAGWRESGSPGAKVRAVVRGGATRQDSVRAGAVAVAAETGVVLVHDGARPFVSEALVAAVAAAAGTHGAAVPVLPVSDTVKLVGLPVEGVVPVAGTVDRGPLRLAQTPQGVRRDILLAALSWAAAAGVAATDDVALVEGALAAGVLGAPIAVVAVPGEARNVKVTRPEDLPPDEAALRVGLGHDVHRLEPGRAFVLAGVDVQPEALEDERFGPVGHSDGDALSHAICDALLSAAGLPDIGRHFPDDAAENAGRSSLDFVRAVAGLLAESGVSVVNVSAVLQLERPKLSPHVDNMRTALATALGVPVGAIGVSAKRGEGLGDIGQGRAVACDAVALLQRSR